MLSLRRRMSIRARSREDRHLPEVYPRHLRLEQLWPLARDDGRAHASLPPLPQRALQCARLLLRPRAPRQVLYFRLYITPTYGRRPRSLAALARSQPSHPRSPRLLAAARSLLSHIAHPPPSAHPPASLLACLVERMHDPRSARTDPCTPAEGRRCAKLSPAEVFAHKARRVLHATRCRVTSFGSEAIAASVRGASFVGPVRGRRRARRASTPEVPAFLPRKCRRRRTRAWRMVPRRRLQHGRRRRRHGRTRVCCCLCSIRPCSDCPSWRLCPNWIRRRHVYKQLAFYFTVALAGAGRGAMADA